MAVAAWRIDTFRVAIVRCEHGTDMCHQPSLMDISDRWRNDVKLSARSEMSFWELLAIHFWRWALSLYCFYRPNDQRWLVEHARGCNKRLQSNKTKPCMHERRTRRNNKKEEAKWKWRSAMMRKRAKIYVLPTSHTCFFSFRSLSACSADSAFCVS